MRHLRHFANLRTATALVAVLPIVLGAAASVGLAPVHAADDRPGAVGPPASLTPRGDRPAKAKRPAIRIEKLDDPGTDAVGLLSTSNGGFDADMWRGSDRQEVSAYLGTMPVTAALPERLSLMRRMLLTTAVPPAGKGTLSDLVSIRLDRLYAMGRLSDMAALARLAKIDKPNSIRVEAEIAGLLLDKRTDEACPRVRRYIANKPSEFLKRALLVCLRLTGEREEMARLLAILREDDPDFDPGLVTLIGGDPKAVDAEKLGAADPLKLALAIGVGAPVPSAWTKTDTPALLRALALFAELPVGTRLAAAEAAFAAGAIGRKALADIYVAATGDAKDDPGAVALKDYDAMTRARLYAAARAADGWSRMAILGRWWVLSRAAGDFGPTARLTAPLLDGIAPTQRFKDQAPLAARVLFFAGDVDAAMRWYRLLADAPFKDIEQEDDLALLAWIADAKEPGWTAERLRRWLARHSASARGREVTGAAFALADAFGLPPDRRDMWMAAVDERARRSAAGRRWYAIQRAAENRQLGEAVVRLQVTLGETLLVDASPNDLRQTIRVLRQLKLDAEARRLALQVLLAKGL